MNATWQYRNQPLRYIWGRVCSWSIELSVVFLALAFWGPEQLRIAMVVIAFALLLIAATDWARNLIEQERRRDLPKLKGITAGQVFLTLLLAAFYNFTVFEGVTFGVTVLRQANTSLGLTLSGLIFVLSCLAAWRNVSLWYRQGAVYGHELKEADEFEKLARKRAEWRRNASRE
ncbi:MAG TPA: hypothetical protein VHN74_03160 [Candidatus Angelobacter sp.]|nr:hypothetical protein [Candidatus Angelobacter sp.]